MINNYISTVLLSLSFAVFLAVVLGTAEAYFPLGKKRSFSLRASWVDLIYLVITILGYDYIKRFIGYLFSAIPLTDAFALGPKIAAFPFWLQVMAAFFVADASSYWQHRLFHRKPFWDVHAVHHSAPRLDWISGYRFHPVDLLLKRVILSLPLLLLGFSPAVIAPFLPLTAFFAILTHAQVPWTFGALRYFIVSPAFHRWHHSRAPEAAGKNLGGVLSIWDVIFGTFYMPRGQSLEFPLGTEEVIPENFWRQIAYPFSVRRG